MTHCQPIPAIQSVARNQRGAVLFISLIILVILSLIGIASMQVTTLQSRMSGNYRTVNVAFQRAEQRVRLREDAIKTTVDAGNTYLSNDDTCQSNYGGYNSPDAWGAAKISTSNGSAWTRRIDRCIPGQASTKWGPKLNEDTTSIYEVVGVDNNDTTGTTPANADSMAVIDTIFVP